jgi:hypothetical protein
MRALLRGFREFQKAVDVWQELGLLEVRENPDEPGVRQIRLTDKGRELKLFDILMS